MALKSEHRRIFSVDFCCVIGIFLMLGFHFFEKSGFEESFPLSGFPSICILILRWLCMAGLPLIFVVNGAAFSRETFSFSQYKGFIKLIYVFAVSYFAVKYITHGDATAAEMVSDVPFYYFNSSDFALTYAMLLLASPFLNCTFQALPSNRSRVALILVLSIMTSLPDMLIFNGTRILPNSLELLYPVTLYFIGAYIYDNHTKTDFISYFVLTVSLCCAQAIFSYSDSQSSELAIFNCPRLDSYSSFAVLACAGSIFAMLCNVNIRSFRIKAIFKFMARCTLPIILLCEFAEDKVISRLMGSERGMDFPYMRYFIPYAGIIIVVMFAVAAIISAPFDIIRMLLSRSESEFEEQSINFDLPEEAPVENYAEAYPQEINADEPIADDFEQRNYEVSPSEEIIPEPQPVRKPRTETTLDSILSEFNPSYRRSTPPDDIDDLLKLIQSGK